MDLSRAPRIAVADLAASQGGHVATWQALALGVPERTFLDRAGREGWTPVHLGVRRLPGVPETEEGRLWAALLSVSPPTAKRRADVQVAVDPVGAVSGWSAARRYGFDRPEPAVPQVVGPATSISRRDLVRLIRSRRGIDGMWSLRDGIPVATPERVLWDCGQLGRRMRGADRLIGDLGVYFDRTRTFAITDLCCLVLEPDTFGLPSRVPTALRQAAELVADGFSHSKKEARGRTIAQEVCRELGLVGSSRPFGVVDDRGVHVAEIDVAVTEVMVGLEIDGPHHDEPNQRRRDRRRDRRLAPLGWLIIRIPTWLLDVSEDLFRARVRHDLGEALASRRRRAA